MTSESGNPPEERESAASPDAEAADAKSGAGRSEECSDAPIRAHRLAAIKALIDAGAYDSDDILEKALARLSKDLDQQSKSE